ncbi:MAG: GntR family transcriptional regulator [Labrys sp. (in: a-proteobacteria)]
MTARSGKPAKKAKGTGAGFVFDALRRAILMLELEPGSVLDEAGLARQYGVSRSPVREAVVKLAATGLVETQRNRAAIVARVRFESVASFLSAQEVVYRLTAREAAKRRSATDIAELSDINARHEVLRAAGDMQGMIELNRDFHLGIARIAGNAWYERWLHSLMDEGQRMLRLYMRSLGSVVPPGELRHHREIIAAIEASDADAADEAARLDADVIRRQLAAMLTGSAVSMRLAAG